MIGGKRDFGGEDVEGRAKLSPHGSNVRLVGLIPDDDLPHFYAGAGCFVYPSIFEGFGLPLVEAMACGTPVIAYRRGSMPALIDDGVTGFLVDGPEDAVAAVAENGVVKVMPGRTAERPYVPGGKRCRIVAPIGGVTIGSA